MLVYSLTVIALLFVLLVPEFVHGHCFDHKDCRTCTRHKTWSRGPCRWCPLDNACHAQWSPKNDCLRHQNLKHPAQCKLPPHHGLKHNYNATTANTLAMFSAMAYSNTPQKCLSAIYPHKNISDVFVLKQACDDFLFDYEKMCMAFFAVDHSKEEIIVSFRGTRGTKQIIDQALTIIGTPSVPTKIGGKVQRYFKNVHDRLYQELKRYLQGVKKKFSRYHIMMTGHSLGGAVASIASATLVKEGVISRDRVSLYTYGMPRVGDKIYAAAHDRLVPHSWRVVREGDLISRFPMCRMARCSGMNGPYHHKTKVLYTDPNMAVTSDYIICNGNEQSNHRCKERRSSRNRQKRGIFKGAMQAHKVYFGIPIGTYCVNDVLRF